MMLSSKEKLIELIEYKKNKIEKILIKYMEIYLKGSQVKNGLKDIQIVKEEQEHYLERNFLINKKV